MPPQAGSLTSQNNPSSAASIAEDAKNLWDDLSVDQKRWLRAFYENEEGDRPTEEEMFAEPDGKTSRTFEPGEVPRALISNRRLTPYGLLVLNRESDVVA